MATKKKTKVKKLKKKSPNVPIQKPVTEKDSPPKPSDEEFYGYGNDEIGPVG